MLLPSYKVSVLYWDKVGSSEKSLLILEVVFGERSHLVQDLSSSSGMFLTKTPPGPSDENPIIMFSQPSF